MGGMITESRCRLAAKKHTRALQQTSHSAPNKNTEKQAVEQALTSEEQRAHTPTVDVLLNGVLVQGVASAFLRTSKTLGILECSGEK